MKNVALIGNPNVGKSVLFYHLTGNYVVVSNYPGTTVEVSQGAAQLGGRTVTVYDTPGMYRLSPITEEEAVARRLLLERQMDCIVHVTDAKNLPRMLPLTLELLQYSYPVILVLNMMDEAEKLGVQIAQTELARRLGIPVIKTSLTQGQGLQALKRAVIEILKQGQLSKRTTTPPREESPKLLLQRHQAAAQLLQGVYLQGPAAAKSSWLEMLTLHPWGGLLLMIVVLYAGLYLFVGRFGAGTLVNLIEGTLLGQIVLPALTHWLDNYLQWAPLRDLVIGEFGLLTMGFRYAFGIILPIVSTFFFVFAILEDSGYLPRLAYWADRWLGKIGLNGRAVIPLTLGLGCGTMAVLVTRTLESARERVLATFLLALAIPCSAQLGLILALLSAQPYYLLVWVVVICAMFIFSGLLVHKILPGQRAPFFMELPPLRLPTLNAILQKTLARMRWYFMEVIPVFIAVSVFLWLLQQTGVLTTLVALMQPYLGMLGLPSALSTVFLYGFFRRDYGTAGLYDLYHAGLLNGAQLLLASIVLTLFLPCLAQLAMMIRERGVFVSALISFLVAVLAFIGGVVVRIVLGLPTL
ncbi:MAG TPA: ferrous iron transporter B [Oscillospiraceae bacterium]|nr:ferrous iron transporter B [Oscillospiraceae bacterium]